MSAAMPIERLRAADGAVAGPAVLFEMPQRTASQRFLIAAGGTGGHVIPALEVAKVLRGRGHAS